jgi:hypothetical protein
MSLKNNNKMKVFAFLFVILLIGLGSSLPTDSDVDLSFVYPANTSLLDVNNSQYLQGYTPTTLRTWMQSFFDTIYCKLTGCTMAGDINMNTNNILSVGEIQTERIVTTLNTTNGFCTNSSGDTFFGYIEGAC